MLLVWCAQLGFHSPVGPAYPARRASGIGNWDQSKHTTCSGRPVWENPTYSAFWRVFGVPCLRLQRLASPVGSGRRRDWDPGRSCRIPVQDRSLVLGAGRDLAAAGQVGKELLQLLLAGKVLRHFAQRRQVAAQPENVTLICGKGFVWSPDAFAHPADCLCCMHCLMGKA